MRCHGWGIEIALTCQERELTQHYSVCTLFDYCFGLMTLAVSILQTAATFQANAPSGTGLEWRTVGSVVAPAVVLVVLVYWGARETI